MEKKVVITGIGVITSSGIGKEKLWNSVLNGISSAGISEILKSNNLPAKIASEITDFDALKYLSNRALLRLDKEAAFALIASNMALEDSQLTIDESLSSEIGVFEGTALASLNNNFERHTKYLAEGMKKISPLALLNGLTGNASGMIAQELNIHGPAITFSNGCVSSSYAIGYAYRRIQSGELKAAITGGAEAPVSTEIVGLFSKANLMSTQTEDLNNACRPFDICRNGFFLGEGGAFLVLEELEYALNRNAHIYAELLGFGESTDAYHGSSPEPNGKYYAAAMKDALSDAEIDCEDIDYLNAHGTASKLNDPAESGAIKNVFRSYSRMLPVSSTKQVTGHLLGSCGSLELIITCLALNNCIVPPVSNLETLDPECSINVPKIPIEKEIKYAMSNNLSFGGRNSSIIIKKFNN